MPPPPAPPAPATCAPPQPRPSPGKAEARPCSGKGESPLRRALCLREQVIPPPRACGGAESQPASGSDDSSESLPRLFEKADRSLGRMTNPAATQNKEIDCLSPEAQRLAEARLAAKRAARAEAREIRMKELERQQKEVRLVVLCGFLSQVFSFWVERAGAETPVAIYTPVRLTVLTIGMRRACDCCSRSGQGVRIARMPGMPVPDLDLLGPETASRAATRLPTSSPAFWPKGAKSCWF